MLINSGCLINSVGRADTWRVSVSYSGGTCAMEGVRVVHSDGTSSSSSSGGRSICSTKNVQIVVFLERWRRSKGVDPCAN